MSRKDERIEYVQSLSYTGAGFGEVRWGFWTKKVSELFN